MMDRTEPHETVNGGRCISCDDGLVTVSLREQRFSYGSGRDAVILTATVPVSECSECDDAWTGHEAEAIREEAVRAHLEQAETACHPIA